MPKLNTFQTLERLEKYLNELKAGEDVALRDIKAILKIVGQDYENWIDEEKERQRELKKIRRARTEEEKKQYGYKTIHEILTEAVTRAKTKVEDDLLEKLDNEVKTKELRQARTFLDAFFAARDEGKDWWGAWTWANNELTRAGLPRVDGQKVEARSQRESEVWAIEDELMERFYNEATDEEREQYDMLHEANDEIPRWREAKMKREANAKKKIKK